jgi:hypothetical protein
MNRNRRDTPNILNKHFSTIGIEKGVFPSMKLKHAKVIPIFKDHDETDPWNYRPISLLSKFESNF